METLEPVQRTFEIEEITNLYIIHPISSFLTGIFARLGVTPNAVSLAGMLFGVLAGFAYHQYRDPRWAIAGFVLMVAWHVMDGADGQLARLTHTQSELGKILDGICDYVTFTAVYLSLAGALSRDMGGGAWGLAITAGIFHAFQSAAYEVQRQDYNFWGLERKSAELVMPGPGGTRGAMGLVYRLYIRSQIQIAGMMNEFPGRLAAMLRTADSNGAAFIRRRYREMFAPAVQRWSILSANYRTLGIFIAAVAGRPAYYFIFEIVGFTAILGLLVADQRWRYRRFFDGLAGDAAVRKAS